MLGRGFTFSELLRRSRRADGIDYVSQAEHNARIDEKNAAKRALKARRKQARRAAR